jgi:LemA protein
MDRSTTLIHWAIFLGVILVIFAGVTYNKLQRLAQNVKEKRSNIQIALSKKIAEINQLLNMVKGYQDFEQFTQLKISNDTSASGMTTAYQQSQATLAAIQGMAQRFPDLKTSSQYHRIEDSIQRCEQNIQQNRLIFNGAVKEYNNSCLAIPAVFVSRLLGFPPVDYLEFDTSGMPDEKGLTPFKSNDSDRLNQMLGHSSSQGGGSSMLIQGGSVGVSPANHLTGTPAPALPAGPQYFYLAPGGVPQGPTAIEEIRGMVMDGKLPLNSMVAAIGTTEWIPISQAGHPSSF